MTPLDRPCRMLDAEETRLFISVLATGKASRDLVDSRRLVMLVLPTVRLRDAGNALLPANRAFQFDFPTISSCHRRSSKRSAREHYHTTPAEAHGRQADRGKLAARFHFEARRLPLKVNNRDAGNAQETMAYDGDAEVEIGFNAKYVLDSVASLPDGTLTMELTDAGSPDNLLADGGHKENLVVLMPMRV